MGSVRSTIDLVITGATRGLAAASAEAEAMAERVGAAEDRVSAARTRSAAAEDKVGVAERRLQEARAGQEAALSRIGVAETNLERVRENSNGATTRLARAQADLDAVRNNSASTAEDIARAEANVNRVRTESDRAAQALQRAEAQLATARANADRAGGRVTAAEAALARARSDAVRASEGAARAEEDLNNLRRRGNQDTDTQRSGILGLFDAFSRLGNALTGADDASNRFLSTAGALQGIFSQIGGPVTQAVIGLLSFSAAASVAAEAIGLIGGLVGQVLGGAIPTVLALAAAGATVALGMDGIKKAAEAAAPAFDKLKKSVSDVFVQQLTPAFKQLGAVLPQLTQGFDTVAKAASGIATQVLGFVTSAHGLLDINIILNGTAALLQAVAPGIAAFVKGLLDAGAVGSASMQRLGGALGVVFTQIGNVFSRLADNGIIQKALDGLSTVIIGLGNVLAPVIDLLIQMGAALGPALGDLLTSLGNGIQQVIPFFVKLADVAGKVLVDAINQLGPPLAQLVDSILPGASQGLDGFASVMHNNVLPAIAGFINFIRTDAIPGFIAFTQGLTINATAALSAILGFVSGALGAMQNLLTFLAVFTGNKGFLDMAAQVGQAKAQVDGFKGSVDQLHDKTVALQANVKGGDAVKALGDAIFKVTGKTVATISNVFGKPENEALTGAIKLVPDATKTTISHVFGTLENLGLTAAVKGVPDTTKTSRSNVIGTQENINLRSAIDRVINKTVNVAANVSGEAAVRSLAAAIGGIHSVTATITTITRQIRQAFATGGQAPGGVPILVGERGPEILTLPRSGGMITNAERSKNMIASAAGGGGGDGITVNVGLSQDTIAGIGEVVIQRRDRTTKRTVYAGSGATF